MSARRRGWVVATALLLCVRGAAADDADDVQSLLNESVVTTASTTAQKASSAPATSVTFTSDELRRYGLRSIAEAINFLSLGVITSDGLRTPDIGSRGVLLAQDDGKHFLLLVNGHATNDPLYGAARFDQGAGIPLDLVDRIEVIVGPGSVLYGSNAMLGVVNVITKSARDYQGGHAYGDYEIGRSYTVGAGAGFAFDLFGEASELTTSFEFYRRFGPNIEFEQARTGLFFTGELARYRRGGPLDGVWGGTADDAYFTEAPAGMLRLRVGDFDIGVMASAYRRGIPYMTGSTNVDFDDAESYELDRSLRMDIQHQATLSSLLALSSRVYADHFDYQRRVNRDAVYGCYRSDMETCQYYDAGIARWIGAEERISFNWLGDLSLVTLLGVDARMRWVEAKEEAVDFASGRPFAPTTGKIDEAEGLLSPYLQQTWNPTRFLEINGGARLDVDPRFDSIVSPRGAVALSPFSQTTFKGIYSQAFRAPTWAETDSSSYQLVQSEDIQPEIARSLEGSVEQRFGSHRLLFGVFRTWWSNLIEARGLSPAEREQLQLEGKLPITAIQVSQYRNVASIENYGYNAAWNGTFLDSRLSYTLNATAAFTRRKGRDGSTRQLEVAPQVFGNARLSYAVGGLAPTPSLAARYVGEAPPTRAFDGTFSRAPNAHAAAEFRATLSGPVPGLSGLSYRLSGAYTTATRAPYSVGPDSIPAASDQSAPLREADLLPVDQFRAFFGLRYDFFGEAREP